MNVVAAFNRPSRSIKTALPSPIIIEKQLDDEDGLTHLNVSPDSLFIIGPAPSSYVPSQRVSVQTYASSLGSLGASAEDAVVYTAVRSAFSQGSLVMPPSTSSRSRDDPERPSQQRRYILSYQAAEKLGQMIEEPPIQQETQLGPAVPRRPKPNMTIVVHDAHEELEGPITAALRTDGSEVYGSDIIQSGNSKLHKGVPITASNESTISYQSVVDYGAPSSRTSYASTQYRGIPSEYFTDDQRSSIMSRFSRFSRGKTATPARHSFLKMPTPTQRFSLASIRTRSTDNMSTLAEGRIGGSARSTSLRSKRSRQSVKEDAPPMPALPSHIATESSRLQVPNRGPSLRNSNNSHSSNSPLHPPSSFTFAPSIDDSNSDISNSSRYKVPARPPSAFFSP